MYRSAFLAAIVLTTVTASAQDSEQLLSREAARRFGLERMWFTQVAVDPARGEIRHVSQHVSNKDSRFIYDVNFDDQSVRITSTDLNAFGEPLGQAGAKKRAERLVADLTERGKTAELVETALPQITLVITSNRGSIDVIDAETGKRFWSTYVGNPDHPTLAAAVSDLHVAVVNGSYLYLLNRETGELLWRRQTLSAPGAGPGLNESFVFVPMFNGALESYAVDDPKKTVGIYRASGRSLIQPRVTPRSVVWPTDRGHMYVAPADRVGIRFRVEAKKTIVATPAHSGRNLFIPSIDGYIYCVDEITGGMLWTTSIGEALGRQPVAVGDRLYVPSIEKNLYCLSLENGAIIWSAVGIDQVLTVGLDRIFCVGAGANLVTLNRETGSVLMAGVERLPEFRVTNVVTNRLFLASPRGLMQGLREVGQTLPVLHFPEPDAPAEGAEGESAPGAMPEGEVDPFTTPTDPFSPTGDLPPVEGAPVAPGTEEANPFGP